jgi:hypothetical protein
VFQLIVVAAGVTVSVTVFVDARVVRDAGVKVTDRSCVPALSTTPSSGV